MRVEPHVNTLDVEAVLTFRKQSALLAVLELGQADGALQNRLLTKLRCFSRFRGVDEDGEGVEDGGVEAACGGRKGSGVWVLVKHDVGSAIVAVATEMAAAGAEEVPAGVEVEADHEDDDEEEDDDGTEHDLAADGVALVVGLGW